MFIYMYKKKNINCSTLLVLYELYYNDVVTELLLWQQNKTHWYMCSDYDEVVKTT